MSKIKKNTKKNSFNKKIIIGLFILVCIGILIPIFLQIREDRLKEEAKLDNQKWLMTAIFTINGVNVTVGEFNIFLDDAMAEASTYLSNKYSANPERLIGLWGKSYDGLIPFEYAKKLAIKNLQPYIMEKIKAKERGVVKDISYTTFFKNLAKENAKRKSIVEDGGKVFGVVEYREREYYFKVQEEIVKALKENLSNDVFHANEKNLKSYFEKNKKEKYDKGQSIKVERVSISFTDQSIAPTLELQKKAKEIANDIQKSIDNKKTLAEVVENFNKIEGITVKSEFQTFDKNTEQQKTLLPLINKAKSMKIEQISEVVELLNSLMNEVYSYDIIRVIDKKDLGYFTYSEKKETIKSDYVDEYYSKYKAEFMKAVLLKVNQKALDRMIIDAYGRISIKPE